MDIFLNVVTIITASGIVFFTLIALDYLGELGGSQPKPPQPEPSMPPIPSAAEYNQRLLNEWERRLYDEMVKDGGVMHGPKMVMDPRYIGWPEGMPIPAHRRNGDWWLRETEKANQFHALATMMNGVNPVLAKVIHDTESQPKTPFPRTTESPRWLNEAERINKILDKALHG